MVYRKLSIFCFLMENKPQSFYSVFPGIGDEVPTSKVINMCMVALLAGFDSVISEWIYME